MITFKDRSVIVTGAGGGLGKAYALELARLGAKVVVNDLGGGPHGSGGSAAVAQAVVDEIKSKGGVAVASGDSVAEPDGCKRMVATAIGAFGRLDAVIHNAGIVRNLPFSEMTADDFTAVLNTHLLGAFHLSSAAYPEMAKRHYGRFVFTSSGTGTWGRPRGANYASAKAGLIGLCNGIAHDGGPDGILANCLLPAAATRLATAAPGPNGNAIGQMGDRGTSEWVVPMAVFLASEACGSTNHSYAAVSGRYGRVFIGAGHGWSGDKTTPPTVDDIASHLKEIDDLAGFDVPVSVLQHLDQYRLGAW